MITCSNCGKQNQEGNKYCRDCGQKLTQEKAMRSTSTKSKRWIFIPIAIGIIVVITAIVCVVVLKDRTHQPMPTYTYQTTPTYQPSTQTYQPPTSHVLVSPGETLQAGHYYSPHFTIEAGKTISISWSADGDIYVWVLTQNQFDYFQNSMGGVTTTWYDEFKTGDSGTLVYNVANTDTYYLVVSNPWIGTNIKVYSATASW